jgi:hypothetical protein
MTNIDLFHHYAGHALQALLSNYREQPLSMLDGENAAKAQAQRRSLMYQEAHGHAFGMMRIARYMAWPREDGELPIMDRIAEFIAKNEKEGTYPLQNIDAGGEVWEVLVTLKKKNDGTV